MINSIQTPAKTEVLSTFLNSSEGFASVINQLVQPLDTTSCILDYEAIRKRLEFIQNGESSYNPINKVHHAVFTMRGGDIEYGDIGICTDGNTLSGIHLFMNSAELFIALQLRIRCLCLSHTFAEIPLTIKSAYERETSLVYVPKEWSTQRCNAYAQSMYDDDNNWERDFFVNSAATRIEDHSVVIPVIIRVVRESLEDEDVHINDDVGQAIDVHAEMSISISDVLGSHKRLANKFSMAVVKATMFHGQVRLEPASSVHLMNRMTPHSMIDDVLETKGFSVRQVLKSIKSSLPK